jgi:hypothetical protein
MTTATITTSTSTITASVDHEGTLTISRDGALVGTGTLSDSGRIEDCDAALDGDPEVSEQIYSQLEAALALSLREHSAVTVDAYTARKAGAACGRGWAEVIGADADLAWTGDIPQGDIAFLRTECLFREETAEEAHEFAEAFRAEYAACMEQRAARAEADAERAAQADADEIDDIAAGALTVSRGPRRHRH